VSELTEAVKEKNRQIDKMCAELAEQLKLAVDFSSDLKVHERCDSDCSTRHYHKYSDSGRRTLTIEYQL
jgi:hypothetical protein